MGVLRPLVVRSQSINHENQVKPSDKNLTLPNLLTISRPILGAWAAERLIRGKPKASVVAAVAAATDMEGAAARLVDKHWPDSGRGTSEKGKFFDPVADTAMALEISAGIIFSPKASKAGKFATALVLFQEAVKSKQAVVKNNQYRELTGENLDIPISVDGKEAMLEKMAALGLAAITHDIERPVLRGIVGAASVVSAVAGTLRGQTAHRRNMHISDHRIREPLQPSRPVSPLTDTPNPFCYEN